MAYVACDIVDDLIAINLQSLEIEYTIDDFPIFLLTYSWVSTGGRSSFKFTRFKVSGDGNYLIAGNAENEVIYFDAENGSVDYAIDNIPNCKVVGLSGDGNKTIALSDNNGLLTAFQIDNTTFTITGTVEVTGYYLSTYEVGVNPDGTKAYAGISNNSSAILRFETSDFVTFTQTYTAFWIGTSSDHNFAVSGQNRFSIIDFENEAISDNNWGNSQSFGCVSPAEFYVAGYDPLRYEGIYFYDCTDPYDIEFKGKELSGMPPDGDTPYRIAISPDGTKAVTTNSISHNTTVIDLATYSVDTIISLGESSDAIAISNNSQFAVLGGYDLNTIKIIDLTTMEFVTSVQCGQRPLMVNISPDDQYAYIGNLKGNSVSFVELDGASSNEIIEIPTGTIGLSWVAYGTRSSVELDPTGQFVLVAASFEDQVQVIDIATQQIVANLPVGTFPLKIAFNNTGEYAAVTNYNSNSYSIIHLDGASSSVVGTFTGNGNNPMRLTYNQENDEFGIVNYDSKTVSNVNPETGDVNSTDYYSQFGNPIMIDYDIEGKPLVLCLSSDVPGYLVRDGVGIELPASPSYFDYCAETHTAVVCMPGPDYVSVIEFDQGTDPPVADFIAYITTIQVGDEVEFTDLSTNEPTSWDWEFEGGEPSISSEQNPVVTYPDDGSFDVTLTVTNASGDDTKTEIDYITVDTLTFLETNGKNIHLSIFPNPASDYVYVEIENLSDNQFTLSLFNVQGRFISSVELKNEKNKIEISNLPIGIYLIHITDGDQIKTIRILKE
jgi:YVTN family beta-propeller protein